MRRTLTAVIGIVAVLAAAAPATATPAEPVLKVSGYVLTTAEIGATVKVMGTGTLSHIGTVTVTAEQVVVPETFQQSPIGTIPATGTIAGSSVITAPDTALRQLYRGHELTATLERQATRVQLDEAYTATFVPGPTSTTISFSGTSTITGDGLLMTLRFEGGYCFAANRGFIYYEGTMTRTR